MKYLILLLWLVIGGATASAQPIISEEDSLQCLTPTEFDFYAKALVEAQAGRITISDLNAVILLCKENMSAAEQLLAFKIKEYNDCNVAYLKEKNRADKAAKKVRFWRNGGIVAACIAVIETLVMVLTFGK